MSDPTILFSRDAINQLADIVADRLADKLLPMLASQRESQVELTGNTEKYLTRKEVAKSLSITLPTLSVWTKSGKLKAYRISRRVWYKSDEVEKCLKPMKVNS